METKIGKSIDKIMIEAVTENFSAFAWKSLNGVIEKCEVKIKAFRTEFAEIEMEILATEAKSISDLVDGKKEINFYIPESSVSFTVSLKKILDSKKFKIYIPKEFEFFERRKHERVQPKKAFCMMELNKITSKKQVHDLSLGGFALILPRNEKISVKKGTAFNECVIEVNGRKIKTKVECVTSITIDRYKLESLPYGGHKISFRFTAMSKEDREYLAEVITIESILNKQLKGA